MLDLLVDKLRSYPDVKFDRKSDNDLEVFCGDEKGFDILLEVNQREHTLHFGTFHWHFDNNEEETNEMLSKLFFGLTGVARIKEFSKKGKKYKWVLQIEDRYGNWFDYGTMAVMNFNFWTKAEVTYLQNNLLPREVLFVGGEGL